MQCIGIFLTVACVRFYYVSSLGVAVPYWDQWDGIGWNTFRPVLTDGLSWEILFNPHNEHWIPLTRLQSLVLFFMNDRQWDPVVEMIVNVGLAATAATAMFFTLSRYMDGRGRIVFFVLTAIVWLHPLDWANFLGGFQGGFYLLLLFLSLAFYAMSLPDKRMAVLGAAGFGCLASISLGGGFLVWPALALSAAIVAFASRDRRIFFVVSAIGFLTVTVVGKSFLPSADMDGAFDFRSIYQGTLRAASWPLQPALLSCLIVALPPALIVAHGIVTRRIDRTAIPQLSGLAWVAGTALALIVYRDLASGLQSRHTILLGYGALCMASIVLHYRSRDSSVRPWDGSRSRKLVSAWLIAIVAALGTTYPLGWQQAVDRSATNRLHEQKVRDYLTGKSPESSILQSRHLEIPLESGTRLVRYLNDQQYRSWLPGNLFAQTPDGVGKFVIPGVGPGAGAEYKGLTRGSFNRGQHKRDPIGHAFTGEWAFAVENPRSGGILAIPLFVSGTGEAIIEIGSGEEAPITRVRMSSGDEWQWLVATVPEDADYSVRVVDDSSYAWVAIGPLRFIGPLTRFRLLASRYGNVFLFLGLVVFIVVPSMRAPREQPTANQSS